MITRMSSEVEIGDHPSIEADLLMQAHDLAIDDAQRGIEREYDEVIAKILGDY